MKISLFLPIIASRISDWYSSADSTFDTASKKVTKAGGYGLQIAQVCAGAAAIVGFAVGLFLLATGSRKNVEQGKNTMIHSAVALILTSTIIAVVTMVLSIVS